MKAVIIALIFLATNIHAQTIKIATITSDADQNNTSFYLVLNRNNEIDAMRYVTTLPNGGISRDLTFHLEDIISSPQTVLEMSGKPILNVKAFNFHPKNGGYIQLDFLCNGLTGSRDYKNFYIKNMANKNYILTDLNGVKISNIYIFSNRSKIVGVIGIKDIIGY